VHVILLEHEENQQDGLLLNLVHLEFVFPLDRNVLEEVVALNHFKEDQRVDELDFAVFLCDHIGHGQLVEQELREALRVAQREELDDAHLRDALFTQHGLEDADDALLHDQQALLLRLLLQNGVALPLKLHLDFTEYHDKTLQVDFPEKRDIAFEVLLDVFEDLVGLGPGQFLDEVVIFD